MTTKPVLIKEAILVDQNITDLNQSIDLAGKLLLDNGYIDDPGPYWHDPWNLNNLEHYDLVTANA